MRQALGQYLVYLIIAGALALGAVMYGQGRGAEKAAAMRDELARAERVIEAYQRVRQQDVERAKQHRAEIVELEERHEELEAYLQSVPDRACISSDDADWLRRLWEPASGAEARPRP